MFEERNVLEIKEKSLLHYMMNYEGFYFGFNLEDESFFVLGKMNEPRDCYWDLLLDNIYGGSLDYIQ